MTIPSIMTSTTNPATGTAPPAAGSLTDVNENQFLTLLVSQIKNQDPTNPTDSTTFVSQLAQFSQLEQMIAIRGDIESQTGPSSTSTSAQGDN